MSEEIIEGGYVYVLYNPIYDRYGEIYKIGQAKDVKDRLKSYSTSYPEESEIKYSIKHPYYKELEKVVHLILKEYRMKNNREYFKCSLDLIKETLDKVKEYSLKEISAILNKGVDDILNGYKKEDRKVEKVKAPFNSKELFYCESCSKKFISKFSLERHDKSCKGQTIITDFRCNFCLNYYSSKQNLNFHKEVCKSKKNKEFLIETKIKLQELETKILKQQLQDKFNLINNNVVDLSKTTTNKAVNNCILLYGMEPIDLSQKRFDKIIDDNYTYDTYINLNLVPEIILKFLSNEKGKVMGLLTDESRMKIKCIDEKMKIKVIDHYYIINLCKESKPLYNKQIEYKDKLLDESNFYKYNNITLYPASLLTSMKDYKHKFLQKNNKRTLLEVEYNNETKIIFVED
jgi:hypothetical protein